MTPSQTKNLEPLISLLNNLANVDLESLAQKERLGSELSFESLTPLFEEIQSSAVTLLHSKLEKLPHSVMRTLLDQYKEIRGSLQQIASFSPATHGNSKQARDGLATALEEHWNGIYLTLQTALMSLHKEKDLKRYETLDKSLIAAMQTADELAESIRLKQAQLEESLAAFLHDKSAQFTREGEEKLRLVTAALDEVRKAAAEAGVSQTAVHFQTEANEHKTAARYWLGGLAFFVVLLVAFSLFGTVVLALAGTPPPLSDAANAENIRYLAQKGLIIFCLIFALIWTARNYGAARHNYVVNKHRNNALGSFQAFVTSASDEQTKNAVLIQATQSVFAPQPSGYVKTNGENSTQSPILEIVRAVGGGPTKEK